MMRALFSVAIPLGLALATSGCDRTTAPSQLPAAPPPQSAPTFSAVQGSINDTLLGRVAGALVEVRDGPQAGASVLADGDGHYAIPGTFSGSVLVRVTKDGYIPFEKRVPLVPMWNNASIGRIDLNLEVPDPVEIEPGSYSVAFTAGSLCADIPDELRTRTYAATITRRTGYATTVGYGVDLSVPSGLLPGFGFGILVAGRHLMIVIDGPTLVESLPSNRFLQLWGMVETSVDGPRHSSLSLPFNGTSDYSQLREGRSWPPSADNLVARARCQFSDGLLTLTRR